MADALLTDERKLEIIEEQLALAEEERFRLSLGLPGNPGSNGVAWPDTSSREEAYAKAKDEADARVQTLQTERTRLKTKEKK